MRMKKGMSPFKGSLDHFALRLEKAGMSRKSVVFVTSGATLIMCVAACVLTLLTIRGGLILIAATVLAVFLVAFQLAKIKID